MSRFQELEQLQAATRAELPGMAVAWLAAVRTPLEELTMAALDAEVSEEAFRAMAEAFSASLPGLLETMDHAPLATLLENAMGAAMAGGIDSRLKTTRPKTQDPSPTPPL